MYAIQITARPFLHGASLIYAVRLVDGVYTGLGSASTVCLGSILSMMKQVSKLWASVVVFWRKSLTRKPPISTEAQLYRHEVSECQELWPPSIGELCTVE